MNNEVLTVVAGHEITAQEVDAFIKGLPREQQMYASNPQFRQQCVEQLMAVHMFAAHGSEIGLEETDEYKMLLENAKKDILANLVMRSVFQGIKVTEDETREFYEANKMMFAKGETVSAKHILVKEEDECNAILAAINAGEKTFEDAAKESSTCPSGQQGGSLGEFGKGQMVKEFEEAAFAAEIGAVVGPVKTQFGYHLIMVEAKNEAAEAPYEEVEMQIRNQLFAQKQNEAYTAKIDELKAKYVK